MGINKPIFIIGAGRSGTTVLYNFLSCHPQLCWFSSLTDRYPQLPQLSFFHRFLDLPFVGQKLKKELIHLTLVEKKSIHLIPQQRLLIPSEATNIYKYCKFEDSRITTEKDVVKIEAKKFKNIVATHLFYTGKSCFLNKRTANTQRLRLINLLFPDANFIHIIRDGRAVVRSLINVDWWPNITLWWAGKKAEELQKDRLNLVEIAGLHWQKNVEEILSCKKLLKRRYLEVRYEKLVEDTQGTLASILKFCELDIPQTYLSLFPSKMKNMNYRWRQGLTANQMVLLKRTIGDFFKKLDYKW